MKKALNYERFKISKIKISCLHVCSLLMFFTHSSNCAAANPAPSDIRQIPPLIKDVSHEYGGGVDIARKDAKDTIAAEGVGLMHRSDHLECRPNEVHKDHKGTNPLNTGRKPFTFNFTPDALTGDKVGKFAYGLAVFSDDGCDVKVNSDPRVHKNGGVGQHLPDLDNSFHILPILLEPGKQVDLHVEYTNIKYFARLGHPDIDGCSLYLFLVPFEINVNDTVDTKDDIVRREQKIVNTAWRQWIPCTVKIPTAKDYDIKSIGITAENQTMRFSSSKTKPTDKDAGEDGVNVELDANGQSKFWITGVKQSGKKDEAKLQIRKNGVTGDIIAAHSMTVFWFKSNISVISNGTVSKIENGFGLNEPVKFSGITKIVPNELNMTASQITNMRIGFVQNAKTTRTIKVINPSVVDGNGAPTDANVAIASTRISKFTINNYVLDRMSPQPDKAKDLTPLYNGYDSFSDTGDSIFLFRDSPFEDAFDMTFEKEKAVLADKVWLVKVKYRWKLTRLEDDFILWIVVFDIDKNNANAKPTLVIPIRQTDWKLHADSSVAEEQTATIGKDKDPDTIPITEGELANTLLNKPNLYKWPKGIPNIVIHPQ